MPDPNISRLSLDLLPGDHACCLYSTDEEHRRVFTELIRRGLERGERVAYAFDARAPEAILSYLRDVGLEPQALLDSGQLTLFSARDFYLRNGVFDPDRTLAELREVAQSAIAAGFTGLCGTGEMTWALDSAVSPQALSQYEADVNRIMPDLPAYFVCQYDTRRFPPHHLLLEMANHPLIIAGTELCRNFLYVGPEDLAAGDAPTATLHRWLDNLVSHRDTDTALRQERSFREAVLNSTNTLIHVLDRDGRFVVMNETCAQACGYSPEEVQGKYVWDVFPTPDKRAEGQMHFATVLAGRADPRWRRPLVTKAGAVRYIDWSDNLLRDDTGEVEYVVVTGTDVTEQRDAEDLLRSERDLGLALGTAADITSALESCLQAAVSVAGLDCGGVYSVSQPERNIELVLHTGLSPEYAAAVSHYSAEDPNALVVLAGEPVYFGVENPCPLLDVQQEGLSALAVIPIKREGQVIACLNAASHTAPTVPEAARHALQAIASHIGGAITRLEAEVALRQSRSDLQTLFDTMDDMVSVCDMDGRILQVNDATCRRLGYTREELTALTIADLHSPEDRAQATATVADILAGDADRCELPMLARDGTQIPVETRVTLGRWGDQPVLFGITRDISERQQIEDALRENERRLASLFDSSAEALAVTDLQGRILDVNKVTCELLSRSREELFGQHCAMLFAPEDAATLPREFAIVIERGTHTVEKMLRGRRGGVPFEFAARLIEYRGQPAVLASGRDITARHRVDAQRNAMIAGLQAIVEGTDELMAAPGLDSLLRRAVEFARERFGLERCAIFMAEGEIFRGTFGTDFRRTTTDERSATFDPGADFWPEFEARQGGSRRWLVYEGPIYEWDGERTRQCGTGQNAATPIRPRSGAVPFGLFFNDNALTGTPIDEATQEVVAVFCSLLAGIIQQQRAEADLRDHANVMQAVAHAADRLLRSGLDDESIPATLAELGDAARVSHVGVFANGVAPDGTGYSGLRHRWSAPSAPPLPDVSMLQYLPHEAPDLRSLTEALRDGRPVFGNSRDRPADSRDLLDALGVISAAVFPIFVQGEWWGYIGFYDCETYHDWSELEMSALTLAADMLGAGIQRKRAEQEILDSRETAWTLLNATNDMAAMLDADLSVIAVNEAMAQNEGKSSADVIGSDPLSHFPPDLALQREARLREVISTARPVRFEDERRGRSYANSVHPIIGSEGAVTKLAVFCQDITDRKQAEQMQRLAAVGQLAAGVAHEFNNLLAAMMMGAEVASQDGDAEAYRHLAEVVMRSTERGADICRNLTAFARPREPRREWVSIQQPIEAALQVAARQLQNAEVQIERAYDATEHSVHIDAGQLEQVFLNMFINASHAMPSGGTLRVETSHVPSDAGPGQVRVRVSDTGFGIAPECLPRVFEPFFTTKGRLGGSDTPGTGLGLSVSHGIVQAHGGQISVQSTVGLGTTFELRLAASAAAVLPAAPQQLATLEPPARAPAPKARILVVDDEPDVCALVIDCLFGLGYEVVGVGNTHEALDLVDTGGFDLIISDLLMPGGGGKAVLQAVRELPSPPPVIVMTGRLEDSLTEGTLVAGASACLSKPFRVVELRETVAELLRCHFEVNVGV